MELGEEDESALAEVLQAGRAAWPDFSVPDGVFQQFLVERLPKARRSATEPISVPHVADLYLACACLEEVPGALAAFERIYLSQLPPAARRIDATPTFVDELRQRLRERLFFAEREEAPKIAHYSGRGPLKGWLTVMAVRLALNLKSCARRKEEGLPDAEWDQLPESSDDAELSLLRTGFRGQFAESFQAAWKGLSHEQRSLLRMHLVDGLPLNRIAVVFKVHRATVARWIAQERETLAQKTKACLAERLKIKTDELNGMMALIRTDLDLSLRRFLGAST